MKFKRKMVESFYDKVRGQIFIGMVAAGVLLSLMVVTADIASAATFKTVSGEVVIEAENYTRLAGSIGGTWYKNTDKSDYTGSGYMQSTTDSPRTLTFKSGISRMEFDINFQQTGTYYLHLRTYATDHANNGYFATVDGKEISYGHSNAYYITCYWMSQWWWYCDGGGAERRGCKLSVNITSKGTHTLAIYRRDKGTRVDRIWLTKSTSSPQNTGSLSLTSASKFVVDSSSGSNDSGGSDGSSSDGDLASKFEETTLSTGIKYYTDRTYKLTSVPSYYKGMTLIKTPNADDDLTTSSGYLTFTMPYDGTVYVAFDSRATSLPNWMNGFTDTGDELLTSLSSQPSMILYSKTYDKDDVVNFGANKASGFSGDALGNYVVIYSDGTSGSGDGSSGGDLASKFEETTLSTGIEYYTDRTYKLTSVPSYYKGMTLIKTPNADDDLTTSSGYLTFTMPYDGTVYVAFDSRATSLPNWMNGFTDTGDELLTSLSSQPSMILYSKTYDKDDVVNFGANKASGFSGDALGNYVVIYSDGTSGSGDGSSGGDLASKFEETTLSTGIEYYTDRTYKLTSVPSYYKGMTLIKTPNADDDLTTSSGYLTFTMPYDGTVYVAFDSRATSLPNWMNGFTDTGDELLTSLSPQPSMILYSKTYDKDDVVNFGANKASGFSGDALGNYVVIYSDGTSGSGDGSSGGDLASKFEETTLSTGIEYYTDRTYKLTSVPSYYKGMTLIKTPNADDDLTTSSGYLTFTMPYDGTVYVAFDSRATSLPNWMNGFTDTGDELLTSLSPQPSMILYSKTYDKDDVVNFGANKASGFSGDALGNYVVIYSD